MSRKRKRLTKKVRKQTRSRARSKTIRRHRNKESRTLKKMRDMLINRNPKRQICADKSGKPAFCCQMILDNGQQCPYPATDTFILDKVGLDYCKLHLVRFLALMVAKNALPIAAKIAGFEGAEADDILYGNPEYFKLLFLSP